MTQSCWQIPPAELLCYQCWNISGICSFFSHISFDFFSSGLRESNCPRLSRKREMKCIKDAGTFCYGWLVFINAEINIISVTIMNIIVSSLQLQLSDLCVYTSTWSHCVDVTLVMFLQDPRKRYCLPGVLKRRVRLRSCTTYWWVYFLYRLQIPDWFVCLNLTFFKWF